MKKKFLSVVVLVAVVLLSGFNVYKSQNETNLSDLALANIEAFAWGGESDGPYYLRPCHRRPGAECTMTMWDANSRCSYITYC